MIDRAVHPRTPTELRGALPAPWLTVPWVGSHGPRKPRRLRSLPQDLGARGKIRDVAIASRCLAALLGIVVTACGPVDVAPHVDWEGRTYFPVSICLDRFDVTDRALSVSASWEHGSVPARPSVGIQVDQAIAVDAEEWGRCMSPGWVTAVADELSNEQEKVVLDRIRAVASPGSSRGVAL